MILGGFVCGIVNTFAGFGSVLSLFLYMDVLGIPGHLANATNRVNVLVSSNVASITFYKNGKLNLQTGRWVILSTLLGVSLGMILASMINEDQFEVVFKCLLVLTLIILLANPKKFIEPPKGERTISKILLVPLFVLIGFYAGFIQAGFGVLFLIIVVILAKVDLVKATALKVFIVAIYSFLVVGFFWWKGMIHWLPALVISIGQAFGGYVAANYMSKIEGANKMVYRLIVVVIILVIIQKFGIYKLFM